MRSDELNHFVCCPVGDLRNANMIARFDCCREDRPPLRKRKLPYVLILMDRNVERIEDDVRFG
jgi:hypothetical protein